MKTKNSFSHFSKWITVSSLLLSVAVGCSGGEAKKMGANFDVQFRSVVSPTAAPTLIDPGVIVMVNGTYGTGCNYQGTTPASLGKWTVATNGFDPIAAAHPLDHDELEVVVSDSDCSLAITDVVMLFGAIFYQYDAQGAMPLTGNFLTNAVAFADPLYPAITIFYANVIQDAGSGYTAPIHAIFHYSSDVNDVPGTFPTTYAMVPASMTINNVEAPDYVFNLAGSTLQITVSATQTIQSVSGFLQFTTGSFAGDDYVVVSSLPGGYLYHDVHAAFQANILSATPIFGGSLQVPGSAFSFVISSDTVPTTKYIIVRRKNPLEIPPVVNPTPSYQVFAFEFQSPL